VNKAKLIYEPSIPWSII